MALRCNARYVIPVDNMQAEPEVQEGTTAGCDGQSLIGALEYGYHLLAANKEEINRLNVFPVPDGDTGTNMLLTLEAALQAGRQVQSTHAGEVAQAVYRGAVDGSARQFGRDLLAVLARNRGCARGLR